MAAKKKTIAPAPLVVRLEASEELLAALQALAGGAVEVDGETDTGVDLDEDEAPKKRGRKPKAAVEDDEDAEEDEADEEDETDEDEAEEDEAPKKRGRKPKGGEVDLKAVKTATAKLMKDKGPKVLRPILASFDAEKLSDVDESQYADLLEAINEALAE